MRRGFAADRRLLRLSPQKPEPAAHCAVRKSRRKESAGALRLLPQKPEPAAHCAVRKSRRKKKERCFATERHHLRMLRAAGVSYKKIVCFGRFAKHAFYGEGESMRAQKRRNTMNLYRRLRQKSSLPMRSADRECPRADDSGARAAEASENELAAVRPKDGGAAQDPCDAASPSEQTRILPECLPEEFGTAGKEGCTFAQDGASEADEAGKEGCTFAQDGASEAADADKRLPAPTCEPRVRIARTGKKTDADNDRDLAGGEEKSARRPKPENPEVSARLSNMSIRHAGSRPDWFDLEAVRLPGVERLRNKLYYKIEAGLKRKHKQMILLTGAPGSGKTTFLAQVYAKLEHAPEDVLTLAPGIPKKSPFRALRNILEQRFYISGKTNYACIERFVRSAIASIVVPDARDGGDDAIERDIDAILDMWRMTRRRSGGRTVSPPPIKTQIVSMDAVIAMHKAQEARCVEEENSKNAQHSENNNQDKASLLDCIEASEGDAEGGAQSGGSDAVRKPPATDADNRALSGDIEIDIDDAFCAQPPQEAGYIERTQITRRPQCSQTQSCDSDAVAASADAQKHDAASGQDDAGDGAKAPESADALMRADGGKNASQQENEAGKSAVSASLRAADSLDADVDEAALVRAVARLEPALRRLVEADARKNAIAIVIDDAEKYDRWSLEILCRLFESLGDAPLTMLWTVSDASQLPESIRNKPYIEHFCLEAMSDTDLTLLTKHVFRRLGESREKMLIPQEICRHIAQRAYGNPKRAIETILEHFKPDQIIQWNSAFEKIRRRPLPGDVAQSIAARFRARDASEQLLLQVASHLTVPFTRATLQSIVAGLDSGCAIDAERCAQAFGRLRKAGFFERSEESLTESTPCFVFCHDCERLAIAAGTPPGLRAGIYFHAAQWYTLNNAHGAYDEAIGDMHRCRKSPDEACRYYERAARRAYDQSYYTKAWPLFGKLLKCLPESDLARKSAVSLDSAKIAFRIGLIDEAFRLCRQTCFNATKMSAYVQAARATLQIAAMLVEIGSTRHVMRYIKRTRALLNIAGDAEVSLMLEIVLAGYALVISDCGKARLQLAKIEKMSNKIDKRSQIWNKISLVRGCVEYQFGNPIRAIVLLEKLIATGGGADSRQICAHAYHVLGLAYDRAQNLSSALESWNRALGMAQEMNDVVLHAAVLADIADGALALEAMRTARAALEQCLGAAQQTRQRALIARCLANTAYLQYADGQCDRAMRTLRKAHKSACSLRIMSIWTRTLGLMAKFYADPEAGIDRAQEAKLLFSRLTEIYSRYGQPLETARIASDYAHFLASAHQYMAGLSFCRKLRQMFQEFGIEAGAERAQSLSDMLNEAMKGAETQPDGWDG